ncbi:hypothetical protein A2332_02280 [Candidatus Uhrbacteria bacterium RIFOXYB2_FULL_41_18]|nr:MAG: hypothetical protein A2332_02280 [Candidatus Uhrbacteria bacterium RIFOXYB2_FULL_41_18]
MNLFEQKHRLRIDKIPKTIMIQTAHEAKIPQKAKRAKTLAKRNGTCHLHVKEPTKHTRKVKFCQ